MRRVSLDSSSWASKDCPPLSQIAWLMQQKKEEREKEKRQKNHKKNESSVALFGSPCCCCSMLYHHAPPNLSQYTNQLETEESALCISGTIGTPSDILLAQTICTTSPFPHSFVRSLCQQQHKAVAAVGQHRRSSSLDFQRMRRLVVPSPPKEVSDATLSLLFTSLFFLPFFGAPFQRVFADQPNKICDCTRCTCFATFSNQTNNLCFKYPRTLLLPCVQSGTIS